MNETITPTMAHARIALANILHCIRRRSAERHADMSIIIEQSSFFWLADKAGLDPLLTRITFREELARIKAGGFGLKGKGRVGGGRKP